MRHRKDNKSMHSNAVKYFNFRHLRNFLKYYSTHAAENTARVFDIY